MQVVLLYIHGILISTTWQVFLENKQHEFSPHIISQVHSPTLNILKDSKAQKHLKFFFFFTKNMLLSTLWNIKIHKMESN